jgi:hypothetical protein
MHVITAYDDIIDSRYVIDRISELISQISDLDNDCKAEDSQELYRLTALESEGSSATADWEYGAALIRDSYFEDYARLFAEDIGAISDVTAWPYTCIDWQQAARELQADYTSITFDGVTYWVR